MEKTKLIIVGAGGHAMSVVDSIDFRAVELVGFIDGRPDLETFLGYPVLAHDLDQVTSPESFSYFIAIGDNRARHDWYMRIKKTGATFVNIIDSSAIISEDVVMGEGNFVGKQAIVNRGAEIGDNNIINTRALIEHRCVVGSHNHVSTNSVLNGDVVLGDGTFVGSSSVTNGQLSIGSWSIIGSGSSVIRSVEDNVTVVGTPARVVKRR
ncbi:MAG: NeuD/PglB/VioB family sugar acetyltransferase [Coriobacteriales bacterium]